MASPRGLEWRPRALTSWQPSRRKRMNMPKFAANLSMMFNEVPFLDRFGAARDAGFQAVEYLFPYEYEPEVVARKLRENHLENVLFNMPPGNWSAGERGIVSLPGREEEFRAGVEKALAYAAALGVTRLHARSEEHTSELQSPCNLVCRLLLEKKTI